VFSRAPGPASLLSVPGVERLVNSEFGGVGQQHDTGEALGLILERMHSESYWPLALPAGAQRGPGLDEDSIVYRLFRGQFAVDAALPSGERRFREEMFLTLQVAPTSAKRTDLLTLLTSTFRAPAAPVGESKRIAALPPVLIVELSRHTSENKETMSQASVSFPGTLVLPSGCLTEECAARERGMSRRYELSGVIVRSGLYSNSGHYWVAQRRNEDWNWINDEEVTPIPTVTPAMVADSSRGLISSALEAGASWCLLVYIDQEATLSFQ